MKTFVFTLVILAILAFLFYINNPNTFRKSVSVVLPQNCTVSISGTNASVNVNGIGADQVCQNYLNSLQGRGFLSNQPHYEPVVCEYDIKGYHFTVRDQGTLKLVGGQICKGLASQ